MMDCFLYLITNYGNNCRKEVEDTDGKHEGTRSLGSPRRGWEDNIKIGLK
jgi:hypothetical protein